MPNCVFRVQPNSLLSLWYTVGCTLLHSWLLYLGFVRYRLYTDMQWPIGAFPRIWLTTYISLLATCIPILALFLAFGLLKSGNLAGDNEQLGARPKRTIELIKGGMGNTAVRLRNGNAYRLCHCLRSAWLHAPPAAQCLHVLLALLQLFVQQTMLAQLYRWGFINSGDFLSTELDWLFQRARQLATNLPMGETRLQSFRISTEELSASPVAPNILPILMHTRLFGIPLEFVNLLIALVAFSTAYPVVFWRVSKSFALLFTAFLSVHSLSLLWTYLSFSVLFRIQETNFYGGRPVGMGQHLWALRGLPLYHPLAIIASFWLTVALMHIAPIALYSFGYGKFAASQNRLLRMRRYQIPSSATDGVGGNCSKRSNGTNGWSYGREIICDGYTPHVLAIVLLLTIAAVKAPTFYAIGLIYQKEERPFLLWCLVADLLYLFSWILLWLLCTVKCRWDFRVHYDAHELIGLQDAHRTADGGGGGGHATAAAVRGRTPGELKGALLLVHGSDVFITDDPVAKPAIMRQVLKSCLPADDLPTWLRGAVPMPNASVPNTHSPQRRYVRMVAEYGQHPAATIPDFGYRSSDAYRTPELGHRQLQPHDNADASPHASMDDDVPLAAPPYQRLASLPPVLPAAGACATVPGGGNSSSFGTVAQQQPQRPPAQHYHHHQHPNSNVMLPLYAAYANNGNNDDYASFMIRNNKNNNAQLQLQQQPQPQQALMGGGIGTLSRSAGGGGGIGTLSRGGGTATATTAALPQVLSENATTTTTATTTSAQHYGHMVPSAMQLHHQHSAGGGLESYATIGRRCSKSSVGSSGFGGGGGSGGSGFGGGGCGGGASGCGGGGAVVVVPPTMPSPSQLLRPKRSASVQAARGEQPQYYQQHHHHQNFHVVQHQQQQQQQQQNGNDIYGQHNNNNNNNNNIYGQQQQFNGGDALTLQRNGIGATGAPPHANSRSGSIGSGTQNGGGGAAELLFYNNRPKLLTPVLQRCQQQPQQPRVPQPQLMPQQHQLPPQSGSTFAGGTGGAGWHAMAPSSSSSSLGAATMAIATVAVEGGGTANSSLNGGGGGTTTPSSSMTIGGDSRVASAASNASSAAGAATYGGDIGTRMNGIDGGAGGGPLALSSSTDCATLTRRNSSSTTTNGAPPPNEWRGRNGRAMMMPMPSAEGKQPRTAADGTEKGGAKMGVPPPPPPLDGTERFATSVV